MLLLKPSKIQGVGVFTTKKIRKGENPFKSVPDDSFAYKTVGKFYKKYCIWGKGRSVWYGPRDFNRMAIWWYLNHSKQANIGCDLWVAIKNIPAGSELTINYNEL